MPGYSAVIFVINMTALDLLYQPSSGPRGYTMYSLPITFTILAGALVAGMDAGLLYNEYPLMGAGWPNMAKLDILMPLKTRHRRNSIIAGSLH